MNSTCDRETFTQASLQSRIVSFFATGKDRPLLTDAKEIDRLYKRKRIFVMTAITLGYGIAYMCRLGLSVVKRPLIDGGMGNRCA